MRHIPIGTCVPGNVFTAWAPKLRKLGFESFAINHHMKITEEAIKALPDTAKWSREELGAPISILGFYCNALQIPGHKELLMKCIETAPKMGIDKVGTFAGALEGQSVDAAMPVFKKVYTEVCKCAEDNGVKVCIENCPMDGTWKKTTCNIGFNARAWDMMFDAVPSPALGLEWEPAHQIAQLVDPVANLRRYVKKVYHMHGKDGMVKKDLIASEGIISCEDFADMRFPGLGDTDWRQIFAILYRNGYDSDITIEGYHDPFYSGDWEATGQKHALDYLNWCQGGSFVDIKLERP